MEYTKINQTTLQVSKEPIVIKRNYTREILEREILELTTELAELNTIKVEMDKKSIISVAQEKIALQEEIGVGKEPLQEPIIKG